VPRTESGRRTFGACERRSRGGTPVSSNVSRVSGWVDRRLRWLSLVTAGTISGGNEIALEGDRWFLETLRGIERGRMRAEHGLDVVAGAIAAQWVLRRPKWLRRRTSRERLERSLQAEAKRYGVDVGHEEFRAFSQKIAVLLELVYTGAVPLDAIAFEAA